MKITDYIITAQQNLFRQKLRTSLTMIAIFIGALTLSLTNGIGEGVRNFFTDQLSSAESENTILIVTNQTKFSTEDSGSPVGSIPEYNPEKQSLDGFAFTILTQEQCDFLQSDQKINDNLSLKDAVRSVYCGYPLQIEYITNPQEDKRYIADISTYVPEIRVELLAGRLITKDDENAIVVSERYATILGFEEPQDAVGKTVHVGVENPTSVIKEFPVTIVGVQPNSFVNGGQPFGNESLVREMYQYAVGNNEKLLDSYSGAIAVLDSDLSEDDVSEVRSYLHAENFETETFEEIIGRFVLQFIDLARWGLNLFALVVLLVAAFGIANTILMSVYERTREIGLMRALGASKKNVFFLMSFEAMILGFWGALIGLIGGIVIGTILSSIASNTILEGIDGFTLFAFPILSSIGIVVLIILISFIASIIPAIKAMRLDPIKALRHE